MFNNLLLSAWRSIQKNMASTGINIAGLSIGMSAAVLIFLWVKSETSFDSGKETENVYRLGTRLPEAGWVWESTPLLLGEAVQKQLPEVQGMVRLNSNNWSVFHIGKDIFYERNGAFVDPEWFSFFNYHFVSGNAANFAAKPFSLILTASAATQYFGNTHVAGRVLRVDSLDYEVSGVVDDPPVNSSFQYKSYMPLAALLTNPATRKNDSSWSNDNYVTFIRTRSAVQEKALAKKISALRKTASQSTGATPTDVVALRGMHFNMAAE
jgi:putative ABC transport system permease protein